MTRTAARWRPVDQAQLPSAADQALLTRLAEALADGDRLHLLAPAVLSTMRDHQSGQPRAQSLTPSTSPAPVDDLAERPTGHPTRILRREPGHQFT